MAAPEKIEGTTIRPRTGLSPKGGKARAGFAVAPILYLLMMAGVAAGVLFSGYGQILRANLNVTNATTAKGDLTSGLTTLAATGVLSEDQLLYCPPRGPGASAECAGAPQKMEAFANADAAKLPSSLVTASNDGSPTEVGVFAAGAGVKQLDPWGRYYIYCRWENPRSSLDLPAVAIISAGANGVVETGCGDESPGGDDQLNRATVGLAVDRASVWQQAEGSTEASFGAPGTKVTVSADGIINAQGMILANTATIGTLVLKTAPLGIDSGGTGATTAPAARLALGAGAVGNLLFVSSTASDARDVLGATAMGHYLFSSSGLVGETASAVRFNLLGVGSVGNDLFLSETTTGARSALGATTMGHYLFSGAVLDPVLAAQARTTLLGSSSVGDAVFTAADFDAALTGLGGSTVGKGVFQAGTEGVARASLGAGAEGSLLFTATSQAHAWEILGLTGGDMPTLDAHISGEAGSVAAENVTGGAVPIAHGGTGATTASAALNNLFGGDIAGGTALSVDRLAAHSISSDKLTTVVAAGTYNTVTVDSSGRVTEGSYVAWTPDQMTDGSGNGITATATGGGYLYFSTAGTTQMTLSPLGYLGLGIDRPEERLHVYNGNIRVSGANQTMRELQFATGTSNQRWVLAANDENETGSSAGSNFVINRVIDGGSETAALTINRASGNALFAGQVAATGGFLGVFTGTFSGTVSGGVVLGPTKDAPSPFRDGETNTGFFSPASGSVGFSAGGVEVLRVTASGSVGIGTPAPAYPLDVTGGASAHLVHFTGTVTGEGVIAGTATGSIGSVQYNDGNNNLAGDDGLVWDAGSLYLGIGTNAPRAALDAGHVTNALILPTGTAGERPSTTVEGMIRYNSDLGAFEGYTASGWGSLGGSSQWTTSGTDIYYNTGNVGIGVAAPVEKLEVNGAVKVGTTASTCSSTYAGTIKYVSGTLYFCNGTSWTALSTYSGSGFGANATIFTSSGTWTPPAGVSPSTPLLVRVLVVGGGAGGGVQTGAGLTGGGAGYVQTQAFYLTSSSAITVTVGAGGGASTAGGTSSFGSHVTAAGGYPTNTGNGGSGGGRSTTYAGSPVTGGNGGTNGSAGTGGTGTTVYGPGTGQGTIISTSTTVKGVVFQSATFSAGAGGAGATTASYVRTTSENQGVITYWYNHSGGGAGGIYINGAGPSAGNSASGGSGGYGYGAGGGSGLSAAGAGAPGVVYVEY